MRISAKWTKNGDARKVVASMGFQAALVRPTDDWGARGRWFKSSRPDQFQVPPNAELAYPPSWGGAVRQPVLNPGIPGFRREKTQAHESGHVGEAPEVAEAQEVRTSGRRARWPRVLRRSAWIIREPGAIPAPAGRVGCGGSPQDVVGAVLWLAVLEVGSHGGRARAPGFFCPPRPPRSDAAVASRHWRDVVPILAVP